MLPQFGTSGGKNKSDNYNDTKRGYETSHWGCVISKASEIVKNVFRIPCVTVCKNL